MAGTRRRRGGGRRRRHNGPHKRKEDMLYLDGEVVEALPNTMFLVRADNGLAVLTTVCGKMRRNRIRVTIGDRVCIEVSPYDVERGRITVRHRVASRHAGPPRSRGPGNRSAAQSFTDHDRAAIP